MTRCPVYARMAPSGCVANDRTAHECLCGALKVHPKCPGAPCAPTWRFEGAQQVTKEAQSSAPTLVRTAHAERLRPGVPCP